MLMEGEVLVIFRIPSTYAISTFVLINTRDETECFPFFPSIQLRTRFRCSTVWLLMRWQTHGSSENERNLSNVHLTIFDKFRAGTVELLRVRTVCRGTGGTEDSPCLALIKRNQRASLRGEIRSALTRRKRKLVGFARFLDGAARDRWDILHRPLVPVSILGLSPSLRGLLVTVKEDSDFMVRGKRDSVVRYD